MKALVKISIIAAGAGLGLAAGFLLRGTAAGPHGQTSAVVESQDGRTSAVLGWARAGGRKGVPARTETSPLVTKLARDLSMSAGVTRWLYWMEAIEKAGPADFPGLARLASGNSTIMRLLGARWVESSPSNLFSFVLASYKNGTRNEMSTLASVLFDEWPRRDPDAVIAAVNGSGELGHNWRMTVAGRIIDQDAERGLLLFNEWNIRNYGPNMKAVTKWADADPRHAAEFALAHPAGFATEMAMETIGKEWAKNDPARALEFAARQPSTTGQLLGKAALKEWAGHDLKGAAEWLAGADPAARNALSAPFVEAWAKDDPTAALQWCGANLTGSALAQAVGAAFQGAARKNVASAAELVLALNPSPARVEAAVAVAQKWFPDYSSEKPVPPEALAWLRQLDADSMRKALDHIHWQWAEKDPQVMAAFVATLGEGQVSSSTYSSLARSMARQSPEEAMAWANQLPDGQRVEVGNNAFMEWQRSQPEAARDWLLALPANDPRRVPLFQSTISSLAWDPRGVEQLASLSANDRAQAQDLIQKMGLPDDKKQRLLDALRK